MKDLLDYIIKSMVDYPDQVVINEIANQHGSVLEVSVARDDLGKIIGKQGRTARAIRAIIGAASIRANKRVILEIRE